MTVREKFNAMFLSGGRISMDMPGDVHWLEALVTLVWHSLDNLCGHCAHLEGEHAARCWGGDEAASVGDPAEPSDAGGCGCPGFLSLLDSEAAQVQALACVG